MAMYKRMTQGLLLASVSAGAFGAPWSGVHSVQVIDSQLNMTAYSESVPSGWRFAGEVSRDSSCRGNGPGLKSVAVSPDGLTEIRYVPGFHWMWTDNVFLRQAMQKSGCPAIDLDSAAGFLVNVAVPNLHKQAAILSITKLGDAGEASLASQLAQMRQSNEQMAARYGQKPQRLTLEGARVRIRYQVGGKTVDEQVQAVVDCVSAQLPAVYMQPSYTNRNCTARSVYIVRTPEGHLDELLNSTALADLNKGTQANNQWMQHIFNDQKAAFDAAQARSKEAFQAMLQRGQADHAALMRQGAAFQAAEQRSFQQSQAQDRATQASIDKAAHGQVLDSLGLRDYKNPSTGETIEASSYYNHQWQSSDGSTLISTDDHGFDPNGVVYPVQQSWTELTPK
jgi:hypothetical protein